MMDNEEIYNWAKYDDAIVKYTNYLKKIINSSINEDYFNESDLSNIQREMKILTKQIEFWVSMNNAKRCCYDLKAFLLWLCEYVEKKENEAR